MTRLCGVCKHWRPDPNATTRFPAWWGFCELPPQTRFPPRKESHEFCLEWSPRLERVRTQS